MSIPETFTARRYPDRTRRAWDEIEVHRLALGAEATGQWVAIRLSDGGSDGRLYQTKIEATRFQLHESQCVYVCIPPFAHLTVGELHRFLAVCERIYSEGGRLEDSGTHVHVRMT